MKRERKLQFIEDSYYIALPPDWVRHWKLKKGDILKITYSDKPVVVISVPEPDSEVVDQKR